MIKRLTLQSGKKPGALATQVDCTPITIFVGPNNSGKSRVLSDLFNCCSNPHASGVVIGRAEFQSLLRHEAETRLAAVTVPNQGTRALAPGERVVGKCGNLTNINYEEMISAMMNPTTEAQTMCNGYLRYNTQILQGRQRFDLILPQDAGDLTKPSHTSFQSLFKDDAKRAKLRAIVKEAFGVYLVIDPTNLGKLRLRLSSLPPPSDLIERSWTTESIAFHQAAQSIDTAGDGIKAFTGMMSEVIAGEPAVLLIDEPEAFLHPHLSFLLGREISKSTVESKSQLFVSTHSSHFVMGCLQSGAPVTIVRLTYRDGVATSRTLPNTEILRLMRNPLLRSTGVLNALFYECVIVTEGDADRAFYQEINERLQRDRPDWGIPNCLFLNAQNKQTVPTIIRPLRELGIAAAGIVDIDVLKEGGGVWTKYTDGIFMPPMERDSTALLRASAKAELEKTGKNMKRDGGINLLANPEREAVENLFKHLADYGLFVVPGGELESWLKSLGVTGEGSHWLIQMFEQMGEDPIRSSYVKPADADVWKFIYTIRNWFGNPARRGIPM